MSNETSPDKPLLAKLRELEVGQSLTYPARRCSYLKSVCSQFGFEWGKKFTTTNNRQDGTVTATRVE